MDKEREQFRAYLLGELAEPEAASLDEQLFHNDDVLHQMEEEQQMLVEEFAGGLLGAEQESRFRAQCARSPMLARNVEEVRALIAGLKQRSKAGPAVKASRFWERFAIILSPALAAVLCLVAVLYVKQFHLNQSLQARLNAAPPISPGSMPAPVKQITADSQPYVAFLAANVVRGSESMPRIAIPKTASSVDLQVEVRGAGVGTDGASSTWSVSILKDEKLQWMSARVATQRLGEVTFLDLRIGSDLLEPGVFTLHLTSPLDPSSAQTRQFMVAAK